MIESKKENEELVKIPEIFKEGVLKSDGKSFSVVLDKELLLFYEDKNHKKLKRHFSLITQAKVNSLTFTSFELETPTSTNSFEAESLYSKDEWIKVINQAIDEIKEVTLTVCNNIEENELAERLEKRGWLLVNGKNKRWFWLRDNTLYWYEKSYEERNDPPSNVKASQPLLGCSVRLSEENPKSFILYTSSSSNFQIHFSFCY